MTSQSLKRFRGDFPPAKLSARRIASALEAPGCHRRTILEASIVDIDKLGPLVTNDEKDRQSPFAIARGHQFEKHVTAYGMADILALAREHLDLNIPEAREKDLSAANVREEFPSEGAGRLNARRVQQTRKYLEQMLTKPEAGINLLRHAMTTLDFGGETAYLEQDVLAFTVKGRIHVVEIKSYPKIDGRADPSKASETVRQAAVYVLSLQELAKTIDASHQVVDSKVMIVLPENLSFRATAAVVDTEMQVRRLRRQLNEVPNAKTILDGLPNNITLPAYPDPKNSAARVRASAEASEALSHITPRFSEGCVSCPLFHFCRDEAENQRSISRLGTAVAGTCGSITTIDAALDLAARRRPPTNASERAVANLLARGAEAIALIGD